MNGCYAFGPWTVRQQRERLEPKEDDKSHKRKGQGNLRKQEA
jgi:hypothetical protein